MVTRPSSHSATLALAIVVAGPALILAYAAISRLDGLWTASDAFATCALVFMVEFVGAIIAYVAMTTLRRNSATRRSLQRAKVAFWLGLSLLATSLLGGAVCFAAAVAQGFT